MAKRIDLDFTNQFSPSLMGRHIEAVYSPQIINGYKDNPLIEALPEIFDERYVATKIAKYPSYHEEQRKLNKELLLHLVQQISDYVEPLPFHLLIEQRLSRILRHGYKARNPLAAEYVRQFHLGFKEILHAGINEQGENIAGMRSTAGGFAILGVSGQGKTTAIESSLLLYPQVIYHTKYQDKPFVLKQLVWLKLNCPFDGSLRGLCLNFLQAVDAYLGTNYFRKYASRGNTVDMLIPIMAQIASLHGLGVLVIDEIQNLSASKSGGAERMLNYFTQLINTIGVPVVVIGTFKALRILSGSFSQARRSSGQGDLIIDRLGVGEEWDYFIERLWKYQWTSKPTKINDSLKKAMYDLSQGIIDIAVRLYMLAQWQSIEDDVKISVSLLNTVAKQHMKLVQGLLKALKRNDPNTLDKLDDLYPKWDSFDQYLKRSNEKVAIQGKMNLQIHRAEKTTDHQEMFIELVKTAIDFGATSEQAEQISNIVLEKSLGQKELVELRKDVYKLIAKIDDKQSELEQSQPKPSKSKKKLDMELESDDLRSAIKKKGTDKNEIYDNLLETGSILSKDDLDSLLT